MKCFSVIATLLASCLSFELCVANANAMKYKQQLLGDGSLEIRFASPWTTKKNVSFESETYTISRDGEELFYIYLGNNPAIDSIKHDHVKYGELNNNSVRRFFFHGFLTDIIVTPRCGHDKYVWLKRMSMQEK